MAPIDYSKCDNIDTDSEPEKLPSQAPAPKASAPPASSASHSASGSIKAVIARCEGERIQHLPWAATMIPEDHVIFSQPVPPVPALIGIPLVLHRVGTQSSNRADLDNQIATYLNINAESGFAPPEWQSHVGTVIIARKDKKPLLPQQMEGVWMFCDHILNVFGEGQGAPRYLYNRQAFEEWWETYWEDQRDSDDEEDDNWRPPKLPYDM